MKVYKSKIVNEARNIMGYTLDVVVANMNGFNRLGNSQNIYQKWGDNFYIDFYNSVFCKEEVDENGDLVSNKSEAFSEINELDSIKNISFSLKEIILICKQNNIDIKLHTKDDYSTMTTLEIKPYEGHIQDDTNKQILKKMYEEFEKGNSNTSQLLDWFQDEKVISHITEIMAGDFEITDVNKAIDDLISIYEKEKLINRRNEILKKLESVSEAGSEEVKELEKELNDIILKLAKIK